MRASLSLLLLAGLACICSTAAADEIDGAWEPGFTFVPYGWLAGVDGEIGTDSADVDPGPGINLPNRVDVTVDGELEEIGFMFFGEWRGERWSAFFDSVWVNVGQDGKLSLGNLLPSSSVRAGIDGNVYELGLGYRVLDGAASTLSLYGGARYYDIEGEVQLEGGLLPNGIKVSTEDSWTDAVIGARLGYRINDRWQGLVLADMGFGDSDASWQVLASISWRFNEWGAIVGGWRYLSLDYDTPGFKADLAMFGPAIGLAFRF